MRMCAPRAASSLGVYSPNQGLVEMRCRFRLGLSLLLVVVWMAPPASAAPPSRPPPVVPSYVNEQVVGSHFIVHYTSSEAQLRRSGQTTATTRRPHTCS